MIEAQEVLPATWLTHIQNQVFDGFTMAANHWSMVALVFHLPLQWSPWFYDGPATIAPDGFSMVKRSNALQWSMHHSPYSVTEVELIVVLSFNLFELWPR